ncbi:hypothetical protein, partial [Streptomyces sp. NPDC002205]|uniref:hypothetical protein n=1 Tax=Streptomyces sp. NPDC002205 TaxID=3154411 RepID=UPI00332A31BD
RDQRTNVARSSSDNTSSAIGRPIFAMKAVYLLNEFPAQDTSFPTSEPRAVTRPSNASQSHTTT